MTATPLADRTELPTLRLLPVPSSEPPYDDELDPPPHVPGRLAPLRSLLPPPLSLVPALGPNAPAEQPVVRTPTCLLPDARRFAHALVQGLLEVQAGIRPLQQLQSATSPELFDRLEEVIRVRRRLAGTRPLTGAVQSMHVQQRTDGVAEICVRVQRGPRAVAIALRLEGRGARWFCVELVEL